GLDPWKEYAKVKRLLDEYIKQYAEKNGKTPEDYELEFINYGRTEFVYVLTDVHTDEKITILAKQPVVEHGKVKQEVRNLLDLHMIDENVVAPIDYFSIGSQELYVTPYIDQARCVASYEKWGMYVPEPHYRFVEFTKVQKKFVNICMIAKLVSYYDFNNNKGVALCKLGGGDFMLKKGWENMEPTTENTLENLLFIAARDKIECSFKEYLDILRTEFSQATIDIPESYLKVNIRGRVPMAKNDIELGIQIGKLLIRMRERNLNV
ncbi:MAG: hypothetical protein IJA72_00890, partial [Clostridia bacterium]|nr:hypothetical protein [Clostridia bacterium]